MAVLGFVAAIFGGGTGVGLITAFMNRKATAAKGTSTLEEASGKFRDEVRKDNAELKKEMHDVKLALLTLCDLVGELLPGMTSLTPDQRKALSQAVLQGKLAA